MELQQYTLTEEQELLRQTVRRIATERVAPRAAEIDARGEYPQDIFDLLRKADLLGLLAPEQYGGSDAGTLTGCLVIEELGRACYTTANMLGNHWVPMHAVLAAGTEEQKRRYVGGLACGELRSAISVTEPTGGSDVANIQTMAVRQGDAYLISGSKVFCTGAAMADFIVMAAKTDAQMGARGISVFIVDKNTPGMVVGRPEHKIGARGMPSSEIRLDQAVVPVANRLGEEREGFKLVMGAFNGSRPIIAARAIGLAQGALDYAVAYAKERVAFGKPIGQHQGLRWMLAEMAMRIEAARQLTYKAAAVVDQKAPTKVVASLASMAKCFATDVAMKVALDAVQVFGAYGVSTEYPVERYMRDAKVLQIIEGTNQIQRNVMANLLVGPAD